MFFSAYAGCGTCFEAVTRSAFGVGRKFDGLEDGLASVKSSREVLARWLVTCSIRWLALACVASTGLEAELVGLFGNFLA